MAERDLDLPEEAVRRSAELLTSVAAIQNAKALIFDETLFTADQIHALEGVIDLLDEAMRLRMPRT